MSLARKKPGPNLSASRIPSTERTTPLLMNAVKKALVSLVAALLVVVAIKMVVRKKIVEVEPMNDSINWGRLVVKEEAMVAVAQIMTASVNGVMVMRTERVRMFLMVQSTMMVPAEVASKIFLLRSKRSEPRGLKKIGSRKTVRMEMIAIV